MKQKDLILIVVIAVISAAISFFASNALFASPKDRNQEVEQVQKISSSFSEPDKRYFNDQAINPTRLITIGQGNNPDPFRDDGN